jgi:hypothetical protein
MDRRVWLLMATFAALALALGTGGFSAAELDRGVQVSVVEDGDAFVGIHSQDSITIPYGSNDEQGNDGGAEVQLMTLENNFGEPMTFDVTVHDPTSTPPNLGQGSDGYDSFTLDATDGPRGVSFPVVCAAAGGSETWTVSITARSPGVTAEIDRSVTIECVKQNGESESTPTPTLTPAPT